MVLRSVSGINRDMGNVRAARAGFHAPPHCHQVQVDRGVNPNPAEPEPRNPVDGSARYRCRGRGRGRPESDYDYDNDNDHDNDEFCDGLFKTFGVRD
jgi:hypothetical protein